MVTLTDWLLVCEWKCVCALQSGVLSDPEKCVLCVYVR